MSQLPQLPGELKRLGQKHWLTLQSNPAFNQNWSAHQTEIEQVFCLSDFIAQSCLQRPEYLQELVDNDLVNEPEIDYAVLLAEALTSIGSEEALFTCLRRFRNLHMLRLAWRDLLNMQTIESSLLQVSTLAQQLIMQASDWLKQHLAIRFGLPMDEHNEQPLFVIGMGKLGGQELNFSSDIDLIFTYPQRGFTQGGKKSIENQQFFTKLAQKLIGALHQITTDGQVYRVDMRLRPFGESGPLVMHFDAMEEYYQDQGREWERYAMLKGRILNPDSLYQEELEDILRPFIYRRYLDYGALDSLRKMKGMITQEVRRRKLANNIKLGRGGIREAEFIVQSLQLIRGGREPRLQTQGLLHNLQQLCRLQILPQSDAQQLRTSYLWLRKVEHSLQQFADKQTQELPENDLGRKRLVHVLGLVDYGEFMRQLTHHSTLIHEHFSQLIGEETSANSEGEDPALSKLEDLWLLELTADESQSMLGNWLDSEQAMAVVGVLSDFRDNLSSSRIGQRGENTLNKLMPHLLLLILSNESPHASHTLARTLQVFKAIYGRTAYLDLLYENQAAMNQLVKLCKASPWVTDQISRFPLLLDELLNPAQLYHPTELTEYDGELRLAMLRVEETDLEQQMEALRQFKLCQQLKIAAADITGALDVMKVSDHLTFLAQSIIKQVVNLAWQHMQEKYGQPHTGEHENNELDIMSRGFAVIGYGKLGGYELGYGSDLDLVFLHDCTSSVPTDGPKPIESQLFYIKLAQRILHLFNTKTASGTLYEVDMRLRPSGNAGLLVCHINSYAQYQQQNAWTWEHQALTRARFIYGSSSLQRQFTELRQGILAMPRPLEELQNQVKEMREKMRAHLSSPGQEGFDLKQDSGGIADIEFIVQYYVLAYSHQYPELAKWQDNVRILETLQLNAIISEQDAQALCDAYLTYRNRNHRLVLQQENRLPDSLQYNDLRQKVSAIWQRVFEG